VKFFRYLVLPFGWSRSSYWFSRLVSRFWTTVKSCFGYRFLSYAGDFFYVLRQGGSRQRWTVYGPQFVWKCCCCAMGSLDIRRTGMVWWFSRAPAFRFYRSGAGILWRSGEQAGQGEQYHPVFTEAGQMQRPYGTRSGSRMVHWEGPEPQYGLPGDGVQVEVTLRCCPPAESFDGAVDAPVPAPLCFLPHKVPGIRFLTAIRGPLRPQLRARRSSRDIGPPVLARPSQAHPSPPYMADESHPTTTITRVPTRSTLPTEYDFV
jgi:hypothetical protein